MNIQQLEYLIAVDKHKHFGKAAQACFVTQPTLSAMIQKLEDELDVKIFDRSSHPIRTTDMGMPVIAQAQKILDEINALKDIPNSLRNVVAGKLTIGVIPTVSTYLLPTVILDFVREKTAIQLVVREMATEGVLKALRAGEIDMGVIATPHSGGEEFYQEVLFNEELMVYSSEELKCTQGAFVVPEQIDTDKVWLLEEGNCLSTQFERICHLKENALAPKNLNYRASNISSLIQIVDRLGGISILPELASKTMDENKLSRVYRFKKPFPYREISMLYYKPTYKQKLIDELKKFIQHFLHPSLNYYQSEEDYINIKPE